MRVNVAHVSLGLKGFDWSVQEIKIVRYRNRGNEDSSDLAAVSLPAIIIR